MLKTDETPIRIQRPGECPKCGGSLEYPGNRADEHEDDMIGYPWTCEACGATGIEWHTMTFVEHDVDGEKGDQTT